MSKKQALILFFLFDIPCLLILWYFPGEIRQLLLDINNKTEMVTVGSKDGFFIFAIVVPIAHLIGFIEFFYFEFIKRHTRLINYGFLSTLILLFISAIAISISLKAKVENAGYMNCAELEWSGTYSVSYTYTRNQEICGQLVAEKAKEKQERR